MYPAVGVKRNGPTKGEKRESICMISISGCGSQLRTEFVNAQKKLWGPDAGCWREEENS